MNNFAAMLTDLHLIIRVNDSLQSIFIAISFQFKNRQTIRFFGVKLWNTKKLTD